MIVLVFHDDIVVVLSVLRSISSFSVLRFMCIACCAYGYSSTKTERDGDEEKEARLCPAAAAAKEKENKGGKGVKTAVADLECSDLRACLQRPPAFWRLLFSLRDGLDWSRLNWAIIMGKELLF
jgi:hypothetical protein